ncbi:glucagon receptor-like isoform X3 [Daphnia pulex]|uniref:glucagon receptor-like isoform X3 n=1 Tax=Daphnia pulex TaxID=6669 RepID=UPI001EDE6DD0|nr:glucagon receptor-like isoform X3 [Daphnia pulex]
MSDRLPFLLYWTLNSCCTNQSLHRCFCICRRRIETTKKIGWLCWEAAFSTFDRRPYRATLTLSTPAHICRSDVNQPRSDSAAIPNHRQTDSGIRTAMHELAALLDRLESDCLEASLTSDTELKGEECPRIWDGLLCWPPTPANVTSHLACPGYVDGFDVLALATRHCTEEATWYFNLQENRTWTNYSSCGLSRHSPFNTTLFETWLPIIRRISQVGYGVSLGTLLIALCILASFKKLYCPRNTLHMHLFISFIMRAFMALLRDNLFVDGLDSLALSTEEALVEAASDGVLHQYPGTSGWECKLVTSLWQYFIMANYSWILMEGLYLHNLIFLALFTDSSAITIYIILGWGLPFIFVSSWVVMRIIFENLLCWTTNENKIIFWLLIRGPITASILVNLIFFLHIAWVLLSKLRSSVSAETRKYRYRKWAKSTLVLVPLFGVHYTVYCIMHGADGLGEAVEVALLVSDQLFASFQGFLVALLYCLMNGEVRGELSRRWKRFRQNHNLDSPWSQYSITNNSRTNTTRGWRTSFHSIQITSTGGDRRDYRLRSLTPPFIACYNSNPNNSATSYDSGTRSTSITGSLHQSVSNNSSTAAGLTRTCCSKPITIANRLEKIVSESEESEHLDIRTHQDHDEAISLADLTIKPLKAISKTSL